MFFSKILPVMAALISGQLPHTRSSYTHVGPLMDDRHTNTPYVDMTFADMQAHKHGIES